MLEEFPHLTLHYWEPSGRGDWYFSYEGYLLDNRCYDEGRAYVETETGDVIPTRECLDDYRARCGDNYRSEIVPGRPGCLEKDHNAGYGPLFFTMDQLPPLEQSWLDGGLTTKALHALYLLRRSLRVLEVQDFGLASMLRALPWVRDGLDHTEAEAARALARVVEGFPAVLELPWIVDGVDPGEASAAVVYAEAVAAHPALLELLWLADGVAFAEAKTAQILGRVIEEVPSVVEMPFLQRWDALDVAALQALEALSQPENRAYLERLLSHPSLSGGITDDWTNLVASIGMIGSRPDLIEVMLDPARTHVEKRVLTLPLAGEVRLSVIWPGKTASEVAGSRAMELLEQAIRSQEEFMGVAFPLDYAILVDADAERFHGASGIAGIIASPWIEDRGLIAHEMAHTYWRDEASWLNEGGASWLDVVALRDYDGTPLPDSELPCELFDNLYDLEHSNLSVEEIFGSGCPYHLGRGLFRELYERLGDEPARRGFGRLYLALRDDSYDDVCDGDDRNGCYVQKAFLEGATPEQAAIVDDIIARRYYGPNRAPG